MEEEQPKAQEFSKLLDDFQEQEDQRPVTAEEIAELHNIFRKKGIEDDKVHLDDAACSRIVRTRRAAKRWLALLSRSN